MNARIAAALFAPLLSVSALVVWSAEQSELSPAAEQCPDAMPVAVAERGPEPARAEEPAVAEPVAANSSEAAPAAPAQREQSKPRPGRRPTWPPPPDLIS